jgi:predicted DNA-binding protein
MKTERAISILRAGRPAFSRDASDELAQKQREEIDSRTNPDMVVPQHWNPLSREAKTRRQALREAMEARLTIFRDNILAVRVSNRVMNNAAIVQVMSAAEDFIIEVRAISENRRHKTLSDGQLHLLSTLKGELEELKQLSNRGGLPQDVLDARIDNALAEYARRSLKIAQLDFEFDKSALLRLRDDGA